MTIAATMIKLFATMLIGFYLGKKDIFSREICKKMSWVIVNISGPAIVLASVTSMGEDAGGSVLIALVFGACCYAVLPFVGWAFAKLLRVDKDLVGTYTLTILLCNNTFMGFPVVQALLGEEAIFYTTIIHFGFNMMFYAVGLALIQKDANADSGEKFHFKSLINPGSIAGILVIILFFGRIGLPQLVAEPLSFIGGLTMPLSMLIIGANMSQYKLKEVFGDKKMYLLSVMRLIIVPLLIWMVMQPIIHDQYLIKVTVITFAMPVASLVAMGTAPYEKQGKTGAVAVAFTTLCSLITIPLWAIVLGM
ncbi:MAG: AEC family transporter [Lachnospiraceae bacterium]